MFKEVKELKKFIMWCKSQKLKAVKIDNIEFEISELALVADMPDPDLDTFTKDLSSQPDLSNDAKDDNEALYWSAGPQKI